MIFFGRGNLTGRWRSYFSPRREFLKSGKEKFLAAFDAQFGIRVSGLGFRNVRSFAFKILVAMVAIFGLAFGASVYADSRNVPADSPIYPLKRLAESVQLAFAATKAKPVLQAKFATRRKNEITDLEQRKPSSTMLASLTKDLGATIDDSVRNAKKARLQDGALEDFCGNIIATIGASSSLPLRHRGLHLEELCGRDGDGDNSGLASTTPGTASSSMELPQGGGEKGSGKKGRNK